MRIDLSKLLKINNGLWRSGIIKIVKKTSPYYLLSKLIDYICSLFFLVKAEFNICLTLLEKLKEKGMNQEIKDLEHYFMPRVKQ